MKYVFIIILACSLVCCRSNKHSSNEYVRNTEIEQTTTRLINDSTATVHESRDTTQTATYDNEYTRTTTYRDDGTVQSIQERIRQSGSSQLAISTGRTSSVSVTDEQQEVTAIINEQEEKKEQLAVYSDSRPVQGVEWLWIVLPIVAGTLVLLLLLYLKYRKKNG